MKALTLSAYGSTRHLQFEEVPTPSPKEGEVQIKVCATSINDWDWGIVHGKPFYIRILCGLLNPKINIQGVDVAGVITACGENVKDFKIGDRVFGDLSEAGFGAFAETVCAPERAIHLIPESCSFDVAAALPHAGLLALQSFDKVTTLNSDSRILINGAGGGMGCLCAQIARKLGVTDIHGIDKQEKFAAMQNAGYSKCFDYREYDFTKSDIEYDFIIDPKANRTPSSYQNALKPGGTYICVGGETSSLLQLAILGPLLSRLRGKSLKILALKTNGGIDRLCKLFEEGTIFPTIDGPHPFLEAKEMIDRFGRGDQIGKVVLKFDQ